MIVVNAVAAVINRLWKTGFLKIQEAGFLWRNDVKIRKKYLTTGRFIDINKLGKFRKTYQK